MSETRAFKAGRPVTVHHDPDSEIQFRISCRGRNSEAVLRDLERALSGADARSRDPLIVLEDLGLLGDSIVALMKGISRRLVGYPRTVTFWECSGYSEAFLSAMEGPGEQVRGK